MKLRYHLDNPTDGFLILEAEPQIRTVFFYSQTGKPKRLPFPYLYFCIRYTKNESSFVGGSLVYPGLYGSGLRIFASLEPLTSFQDEVLLLPIENRRAGLVCTAHHTVSATGLYDGKTFNNLVDLAKCVITCWWSHLHEMDYAFCFSERKISQWSDASFDDLKKAHWLKEKSLNQALRKASYVSYGPGWAHIEREGNNKYDITIPKEAVLINALWPPESS